MSKIEIHNIEDLIKEKYPPRVVGSLIEQVLLLSMQVKNDYPDYRDWFNKVQVPGLYDGTRNIIIAHINDRIVGFVSLKNTEEEKKICTFYVEKNFRKNKIGTILIEQAINYLETEKPLITIPLNKLHDFTRIGERLNWEITDVKENLYRTGTPEVIVNGYLTTTSSDLVKDKSLKQLTKEYKIYKVKQLFNNLFKEKTQLRKIK